MLEDFEEGDDVEFGTLVRVVGVGVGGDEIFQGAVLVVEASAAEVGVDCGIGSGVVARDLD